MITHQHPQRTVKTQPGDRILKTVDDDIYAAIQCMWRDHFVALDERLITEMRTVKEPVQAVFFR